MSGGIGGNASRFGDTPLAFSLTRFEAKSHSETRAKWFFGVSRYIRHEPLIEIEADIATLREMQRWIERAIETVSTDGKRLPDAATPE